MESIGRLPDESRTSATFHYVRSAGGLSGRASQHPPVAQVPVLENPALEAQRTGANDDAGLLVSVQSRGEIKVTAQGKRGRAAPLIWKRSSRTAPCDYGLLRYFSFFSSIPTAQARLFLQDQSHVPRHPPHRSGVPAESCRYFRRDDPATCQRQKPLPLSLCPFLWLQRFHFEMIE
jgi:hypothetical protein